MRRSSASPRPPAPAPRRARTATLAALFGRATPDERSFLQRLLVGELRQGALEGVMEEGIIAASGLPKRRVRHAIMVAGSPGEVARAALEEGEAGLDRFGVRIFRPLQPMLAQPCDDLAESLAELGRVALELKLDGARIQVHREKNDVAVYSRSLRDVTGSVPEVVAAVLALPARAHHPRRRGDRAPRRRPPASVPGHHAPLRPQARRRRDARRATARALLLRSAPSSTART